MKVSILYGSTTGTTEQTAGLLKDLLKNHEVEVASVAGANEGHVKDADMILLGSSTWGYGELQDDFADYIDQISPALYGNKKVAVFGCGDQAGFADVFCEAVTIIEEQLQSAGAEIVTEGLRIDGAPDDNMDIIEAFVSRI